MINFDTLTAACRRFPKSEMPFITELSERLLREKTYRGLKIIHNVHLTLSTIRKLIPLLYSGAEVFVTATSHLNTDPVALKILKEANVNYLEEADIPDDFDIVLDCCAGLIDKVHPRIGAVELTQTGDVKYALAHINYPAISIDNSHLKKLETLYGTGDGFIRAFLALTKANITNKKFVVFGYGKVGQGVVKALLPYTKFLVVIEKDPEKLRTALNAGIKAININAIDEVREEIQEAFSVITATGKENVISQYFQRSDFSACKYLANIGSEDEFGEKFSNKDVLFDKKPINFSLEEPTRIRFLDPIFYIHNAAIDLLLSKKMRPGLNLLPRELDVAILNRWGEYYDQDISEIVKADPSFVVQKKTANLLPKVFKNNVFDYAFGEL